VRIVWNVRATNDLIRLREFIAETDPDRADLVARRIRNSSETLATFPHRGRIGRLADTRELVVPRTPYIVVYWVVGDVVEILRVVHGAQNRPPI
jgi:toxin ParE1/3/4